MNYYFHLPFCRSKCGYCAFYSEPSPDQESITRCLDRFEEELSAFVPRERCETVYLGGGTPTLLSEAELERLFTLIDRRLHPDASTEISIEANPETLDKGKVQLLRGFATRLSLGIQSFHPEFRRTLGRDSSQKAVEQAIELVAAAEFPHWNLDLIYAIPGQSAAAFRDDLERAVQLPIDHLSCYSLTPEEGARLSDELIPDDDEAARIWQETGEFLAGEGFRRYEISNYARTGGECRHNCNVWRGGLLRGFGPAAASFDGTKRFIQAEPLTAWLAGTPPETDEIPPAARRNEIFAINLRTADGWTPELWAMTPDADPWEMRLAAARRAASETSPEFFDISRNRVILTGRGLLFWNTIAEAII